MITFCLCWLLVGLSFTLGFLFCTSGEQDGSASEFAAVVFVVIAWPLFVPYVGSNNR